MELNFSSILGQWGIYRHLHGSIALVHHCGNREDLGPMAIHPDGRCRRCHKQIPEEVANAALFIPRLTVRRYNVLYEDK